MPVFTEYRCGVLEDRHYSICTQKVYTDTSGLFLSDVFTNTHTHTHLMRYIDLMILSWVS